MEERMTAKTQRSNWQMMMSSFVSKNYGGCWMIGITVLLLVALLQQYRTSLLEASTPAIGQAASAQRLLSLTFAEDGQLLPLFPLRTVDYIGFASAIAGLMLSASGGIGGGGLLVPIFVLIIGFPIKHAVSLSNVTVFGGAVANTILNARKRHPLTNRPLIDWDLLAMMEPSTMLGALIGADITATLPDVVVVILLGLLLAVITVKTLHKANQLYDAETVARFGAEKTSLVRSDNQESTKRDVVSYGTDDCAISGTEKNDSAKDAVVPSDGANDDSLSEGEDEHSYTNKKSGARNSSDLALLLEEEARVPWNRIFQMVGLFLTVVILNLLKGSGDSLQWLLKVDIRCGSVPFFLLEKAMLAVIILFSIYIRRELIRSTTRKQELSYTFVEGDVIWDSMNTLKYTALCSGAGLCAGLFGIGGGIVKSPLMLEMGIPPSVASATSATMILFTSVTATSSYVVFGQLNYQYAAVCVVIGFLSTVAGQLIMQAVLARYNRTSYIAYNVALVVGISAVAMSVESILAIAEGHTHKGAGMCNSFNG